MGKLSPRSYLPTNKVFQNKRCNTNLHSLPKPREMNKNTKQERESGIKKKEGISKTRDMESLKMKKVLINSSQAP